MGYGLFLKLMMNILGEAKPKAGKFLLFTSRFSLRVGFFVWDKSYEFKEQVHTCNPCQFFISVTGADYYCDTKFPIGKGWLNNIRTHS